MNDTIDVSVRRSPKYSAFIILGVILGMIAGGILSFLPVDTSQLETQVTQSSATWTLMVILGAIGGFAGAAVALILDRISLRRARTYQVPAEEEPEEAGAPAVSTSPEEPSAPEELSASQTPEAPAAPADTAPPAASDPTPPVAGDDHGSNSDRGSISDHGSHRPNVRE